MASLAEDGLGFSTCIAHSKSTLPSTSAIMSGLYPSRNTVGITGDVLPEEVTTVADRFADAGYATAGLSRNSYFSGETELNRGFERFFWLSSSTILEAGPSTLAKYFFNIRRHSAGLTMNTAKHASPYLMNDVAKRWLRDFESEDDPFFFYLHYNEPHRPYYPPLSYLTKFTDDIELSPKSAAERALEIHEDLDDIIADGCELSDADWEALHAMYDAEIAYTDQMIGRLVDSLDGFDLGETVVVVTADHGELFGEYGLLSHKYVLHDSVLRVPMVVSGLDIDLAVDEDDLVQHNDVMRTLLEMAGAGTDGHTGRDLRRERPEYAIAQRGPIDFDNLPDDTKVDGINPFFPGTTSAIRTDEFKYLTDGDRSLLFELPNEKHDVSDLNPDFARDLESDLSSALDEHGEPIAQAREGDYSEEVKRQLNDLGYIE
jgi:arylsulfatase A-like enzyme